MSIAIDLALAVDPVAFARRAGMQPDPWQQDVLRSTADRILLLCSRQAGKTTTVAVLAMHTALYEPGSLILLLSRAERQSQELYRRCLDIYRVLGRPVDPDVENKMELELSNHSRLIALPGTESTVRSFSGVRLLLIDEASRVPDELYHAVRPMLAVSGGRLIALSTPWAKVGWFYEAWTSGQGWERYEVPATACPRISPAFLAEERAELPRWVFEREYELTFTAGDLGVFDPDLVRQAITPAVEAISAPVLARWRS